jgi:hypothetical protein
MNDVSYQQPFLSYERLVGRGRLHAQDLPLVRLGFFVSILDLSRSSLLHPGPLDRAVLNAEVGRHL